MDYLGRLKRIKRSIHDCKLDGLLVTHLPNIRYLCGFTGSSATLVVTQKKAIFFTDGRYTDQAREEVKGAHAVITRRASLPSAAEWLKSNGTSVGPKGKAILGIEGDHLTVAERRQIAVILHSGFRLKEASPLVERARMVKDADEIDRIRTAVVLGASLFDVAVKIIRPGTKEVEVAAEMEYTARRAGADAMSFETIIAAGQRSALPHGRATDAAIPANGFVVCDFGVILSGYCSDRTRTVHVGRPTEEARGFYDAVREAQQAAIEAVRPGVGAGQVDWAARNILKRHKLARYFTHSTGHGVGLEIHEAPRLAASETQLLDPGMVITIEPGAYLPGRWGVRIEDMVLVTEDGCEVLTPANKELITI